MEKCECGTFWSRSDYKEYIKSLLKENPNLFPAIKSKYLDAEMIQEAIRHNPSWIKLIKDPGFELCKYAVSREPKLIFVIPPKYRSSLKEFACVRDPQLISMWPWTKDEIYKVIEKKPSYIKYFSNPGRDLIRYAISLDPNIALYYHDETFGLGECNHGEIEETSSIDD